MAVGGRGFEVVPRIEVSFSDNDWISRSMSEQELLYLIALELKSARWYRFGDKAEAIKYSDQAERIWKLFSS